MSRFGSHAKHFNTVEYTLRDEPKRGSQGDHGAVYSLGNIIGP